MRVELYCGDDSDRLARLAVLENAGPSGVWRGRLPKEHGVLAASIAVDGQPVLGRMAPFGAAKNIMPSLAAQLAKLPALLWKRGAAGPDGESLSGVKLTGKAKRDEVLANVEIELPGGAGQDLAISGWAKGGHVDVALILPDGTRKDVVQSLGWSDTHAWLRFDFRPSAEKADRPEDATPAGTRLVLTFAPGGEYSGIRVIATERKPKGEANGADAKQ